MKRRTVALAGTAAVAAGLTLAWPRWGPPLGRKIAWFAAERVEVAGAHLLAPHEVLRASGLGVGVNVWTDPAPAVAALLRNPAVARAEVTRELPWTLRISVVEKVPAALVQAGTLRPATADGEVLAVDPARAQVDLPIFTSRVRVDRAGRIADADARAALAETARLAQVEPALMARVSEVRPAGRDGVRLVLTTPAVDVLVRPGIGPSALARLRAALDEVARRAPAAADSAHAAPRPEVDARFEDQVVVRAKS